jgi:CheY-like chemotaxis protein/DNA-binding HxlR family transcriptional regulator
LRVLVVDDNSVFRTELGELLEAEGQKAEVVASVAQAVERLERGRFDLILTDLKMPRESGLDLLRTVRERWPGTLAVMITGRAAVDSAVEAMRLGAFDYLAKPFRPDQLRETLRLAEAERRFLTTTEGSKAPEEVLEELVAEGRSVLVASERPPEDRPRVTGYRFGGDDLARLRAAVDGFLDAHPDGDIVLPEVHRMLRSHRVASVVGLIHELQGRLADRGRLVLGFESSEIEESAAVQLRSAIAATVVHGTLEAVANPIRRRVLDRLSASPASFTEVMRAAGLDDSPKLSFHLRKLADAELIARSGEEYRLTTGGRDAVQALRRMESTAASRGPHDFVFVAPPADRRPSGSPAAD